MRKLLLGIGLFIALLGWLGPKSEIEYLENYIERTEKTVTSHDEAMRLRSVKEYLGEVKTASYIITGVGFVIIFVGITTKKGINKTQD
jgi:hypothetical protein